MFIRVSSRGWIVVGVIATSGSVTLASAPSARSSQAASTSPACVDLGTPKPTLSYVHRYSDNVSGSSEYANKWEQFTAAGSRLVTTKSGGAGVSTYVSQHRVVDDVFVLDASTASGTDAGGPFKTSMAYKPGAIGDPAFRACAGKTWTIPAVNATSTSMQGSFSAKTDPGTLAIVAIRESVTVPAGTFDTVRYTKTMNSGRGQVKDEFWKSIEHGVTVKRNSTVPGAIATEVLIAIR